MAIHYIVTKAGVEQVSERSALRHRRLLIDEDSGDITVLLVSNGATAQVHSMSSAELTLIAREARRAAARRFWRKLRSQRGREAL